MVQWLRCVLTKVIDKCIVHYTHGPNYDPTMKVREKGYWTDVSAGTGWQLSTTDQSPAQLTRWCHPETGEPSSMVCVTVFGSLRAD